MSACPQSHLAKKAWETPCCHLFAQRRTRWRLHIVMYILRCVRRGVQCCRDKGPGAQVPAWWPPLHTLGIAASPGLAKDHTNATHLPSCLGLAASDHLGVCSVMQRQGKSPTRWPPLHLLGIAASPGSARDHTSTTYRPLCMGLAASDHSGVCNTV